MNPVKNGQGLFLGLTLLFLSSGCGTVPKHYVPVLPAPVSRFPPVKTGMVRLPVIITFPKGGDLLHHLSNFLKGGIRQFVPEKFNLPGFNVMGHLKDLWGKMQEPIFLEKGAWLLIRPETLSVGRMRTDLRRRMTAHTVLEMTALPEIIFGPKPLTTPRKMPPLSHFQRGPGTFQAMSNTRISYKEANQYFRDPRLKLKGMIFPGTGERKLTLEGVRLYGSGGKVIAEVKLHYNPLIINFGGKPAKLTVYLRGTPRYLPKQRVFDLPDLDYDIKSNDLILQIADFIFKSDFKNEIRRIARLPIGLKMDIVKEKINKALNRPLGRFTCLHTQVNSFDVLNGFADNEGIEVRISIKGTATMEVVWN